MNAWLCSVPALITAPVLTFLFTGRDTAIRMNRVKNRNQATMSWLQSLADQLYAACCTIGYHSNSWASLTFTGSAIVDGACYNPEWEVYEDQNSRGASQYEGPQSVQECLDYCGSQSKCVAVDVDLTQQPPTCWPHFSTDDLLSSNVFSQPGTNQYRLIESCASGPITGLWFNSIFSLLSFDSYCLSNPCMRGDRHACL